jgi:Novel STAND NTPase 1
MHALGPQSHTPTSGLPVDRYPGVQPFGDSREDRLRLFGRDEETSVLLHRLLGVDMLVLFAKPGLGKTSLLRVHLFPRLRERDFLPVPVRFNHADPAFTPMQVFTAAIDETCAAEAIDYTAGDPKSRWALFKTAIFRRGDRLQTTVLILDQFEEIFTLQREEFRHAAAAELGQLLGSRLPEPIRQQLQAGQPLPFSGRPPEVKVLFSLREDELGMLQELTPELPAILQHRFRLTGLSDADARRAVTEPAGLMADDVPFATEPFVYDETTVTELMATARTNDGHIDPFVLQIFCGHIEKQVRQRQAEGMPAASPLVVVTSDLHGGKGRKAPPSTFYLEVLDRLPGWTQRRHARRLCEDGLLTGDGRRRSLLQEDLKEDFNLDDASLELLEQARLLRKEARPGGLYYEISHDRLAEAIRNERRWRLPRGVKIGLAMVVAVVIVAASLHAARRSL